MKKLNNKGFVLLETIVVALFVVTIFTFTYTSIVPLLGKYDDLTKEYDVETIYELYLVRDAMYKDSNFENIIHDTYGEIDSNNFNDNTYFYNLENATFEGDDYRVYYVKEANKSDNINNLLAYYYNNGIDRNFKKYIQKISSSKSSTEFQNFLFINHEGNYAYLGFSQNPEDPTNYKKPKKVIQEVFNHEDKSGANPPILADGMIPIYYDTDELSWAKADETNLSSAYYWYDYLEQRWANVALVKEGTRSKYQLAEPGTLINSNDIIGMYVWIPCYEYYITGSYGLNGTSLTNAGEILIHFTDKNNLPAYDKRNDSIWRNKIDTKYYYLAPGFLYKHNVLNGLWFSKFEMSKSDQLGDTYGMDNGSIPYVIPNVQTWQGDTIADFYYAILDNMNGTNGDLYYGLSRNDNRFTIDTHAMKNEDWAAVAYLSQSMYGKYGNTAFNGQDKVVYLNNRISKDLVTTVTGASSGGPASKTYAVVATSSCSTLNIPGEKCYAYDVPIYGTGASTTGNIYGIYDMSGGNEEYIMGSAYGNTTCTDKFSAGLQSGSEFTGFNGSYYQGAGCYTSGKPLPISDHITKFNSGTDLSDSSQYGCDFYSDSGDGSRTNAYNLCIGQALYEVAGWNNTQNTWITNGNTWITRGGSIGEYAGIFAFNSVKTSKNRTTRPTIVLY